MNEDRIVAESDGGISFVGYDAVSLYRVMQLRMALGLYAKCGMIPTRGVGPKRMLGIASEYTGKRYAATRAHATLAVDDLTVWIETMKSALPVEVK
jgi:hypothetical protein